MKKDLTYNEFDALCDRLEQATFRCEGWWPTIDEINEMIKPKIKDPSVLEFALWISITADAPSTEEQKVARTHLNNLINNNLKLKSQRSANK